MQGIIILGITALFLGVILSFAEYILKDNQIEEIEKRLPGYNCGACGHGSCKGMAIAIKNDISEYKKCRILRGDKLTELEKYLDKHIVNKQKI